MASGERDLTRGSVWRQVLAYAMPLVASSLLQALYSMVDTVIAGHFAGSAAISAINNSGQILNILTKIAIGITTGGNIIIGQYYGAKEQGRLGEASGTLLSLSLLLGAATAVGLYAGAYPLLGLLGAPAMEQSVAYLRICAVGMVFVFGYNALSAVLRGVGDSRTPLLIIGVATVVNTVLDLWFVAGLGMGTAGAALATTAAQAVSFGMALVLVARRTGLLQPKLSFFRMHGALLRLILRLGIPSALQMTIAGFSWLVVTFLVNQYGVDVSAGNGVAIKIKDICQLFISAMASGATTMIAQNLGASKFERAKDVMYTAMKITCAMAAAMIVLVELFAPQMAAVFTNEAAVRDAAVLNLRIEILGQIFYAVFMVYLCHAVQLCQLHRVPGGAQPAVQSFVGHLRAVRGLCRSAFHLGAAGLAVHPLGRLAAQFGQNRKVTSRTGPFRPCGCRKRRVLPVREAPAALFYIVFPGKLNR